MKGMSLSINIIVIIAIAVIVLLVLSSFFVHTFTKSGGSVSDTDAWTIGCGVWRMQGCKYIDTKENKCPTGVIRISGYNPEGKTDANTLNKGEKLHVACESVLGVCSGTGSGCSEDKSEKNKCWQNCCQLNP